MVNIFNVCARSGASYLVWMCWNGNKKSNCKVGYGSNLLALTAKGARIMMMNFTEWFDKDHWDLSLRYALQSHGTCRAELCAGFLCPAMGHYDTHESGCSGEGVRDSQWDNRWIHQGTRPNDSSQRRTDFQGFELRAFAAKGAAPILHERIPVPEEEERVLQWWTGASTMKTTATSSSQPKKGRNKMTVKWVPKGGAYSPDKNATYLDRDASFGEIQISHSQLMHPHEKPTNTRSFWRKWRAAVANFERRNFTNNPVKAATSVCLSTSFELHEKSPLLNLRIYTQNTPKRATCFMVCVRQSLEVFRCEASQMQPP